MHKSGSCTMCINCAHMHIGLFLNFGGSDQLHIAYDDSPKCFSTCGAGFCSCIVKYVCIMCINCAKKSKNNFFCHFLGFASFNWLSIAYDDSPKYFSTSGSGYRSCTVKYVCIMCINSACINCAHMHIGLFLNFGGLDWLDIAYYGSP